MSTAKAPYPGIRVVKTNVIEPKRCSALKYLCWNHHRLKLIWVTAFIF